MNFARLAALPCLAAVLWPSVGSAQPKSPCESYNWSSAVFVGTTRAAVTRNVQLPDQPLMQMTLTPIDVSHAYLGVTTAVVYITTGGDWHAPPDRKYLVYGGSYGVPDIFLVDPGLGLKEWEKAANDISFLESLTPVTGGTITGTVEQKEIVYGQRPKSHGPLAGVTVRLSSETRTIEATTDDAGRFVVTGLADGVYELRPQFSEGLVVLDPTSRIQTRVRQGGCANVAIEAVFNGRVRGVLRGPDGRPLQSTTVDLMPMDGAPDSLGHIAGTTSVSTNDDGEFEFAGRAPGRYYLGVSLYNAPNPYGPSYPRTYYPGTTDRSAAVPVIIERGRASEFFDLSIGNVLRKGSLEFTIDAPQAGTLKVCYKQLGDAFTGRRTSHEVDRGTVYRRDVVEGERYEIHLHLEYPGGHLESEPFIFTATAGKTIVTLRPDRPRDLDR